MLNLKTQKKKENRCKEIKLSFDKCFQTLEFIRRYKSSPILIFCAFSSEKQTLDHLKKKKERNLSRPFNQSGSHRRTNRYGPKDNDKLANYLSLRLTRVQLSFLSVSKSKPLPVLRGKFHRVTTSRILDKATWRPACNSTCQGC